MKSEIQRIQQSLRFPASAEAAANIFSGLPIKDADPREAKNAVYKMLIYIKAMNNEDAAEEDVVAEAHLLVNEVRVAYPFIKLGEVGQALRRGVRGEYGKFYGLKVITYLDFIRGWLDSNDRKRLRGDFKRLGQPSKIDGPKELTKEQEDQIIRENYSQFEKTGDFDDRGGLCYKILKRRGLIEDQPEPSELYEEAQRVKLEEIKALMSGAEIVPFKAAKEQKRKIEGKDSFLVMKEAEKMIVRSWFQELQFEEENNKPEE